MKYKKQVTLKNGEDCLLRSLEMADAKAALAVCRKAAGETQNLNRYADEWTLSEAQEETYIRNMELGPKSLMIGAFVQGRLAGMASFMPAAPGDRARHRATVGVVVLKAHWNRGIGAAMMHALISQARETAIEQLELEVVSGNASAIRLYARCGFVEYARHPRRIKHRDGTYDDVILMMLELRKA